jgi:hypothetical protein
MYQAARRHIPEHRRLKRRFLFLGTDQRKVCPADTLYKAVNASRMTWYAVIILCDTSVATFMSGSFIVLTQLVCPTAHTLGGIAAGSNDSCKIK